MAQLKCSSCGLEFYGDLPVGHGLYYPALIEQDTGFVHNEHGANWFADILRESYKNRVRTQLRFTVEDLRPLKNPLLLNCLDTLYGHSLLKLLNTQYYLDHHPDLDLILLIPRLLRWMVPEGVASIWTVDLPLKRGSEWNDWLATEIKNRIPTIDQCWISIALSHPHPEDFDIERFTRVFPFPLDEWEQRLKRPTVTFIWREDRLWDGISQYGRWNRLTHRLKRKLHPDSYLLKEQTKRVQSLAQELQQAVPQLDFAVVGFGSPGGLPDRITDLRTLEITEHVERAWCERYAQSHVAIGVHGSNMLLPSAHVGTVVELVPGDRWGNLVQDMLIDPMDSREAMYRYRFLPADTSATLVATVVLSLLRSFPEAILNFKRPWCDHMIIESNPQQIMKRRDEIAALVRL